MEIIESYKAGAKEYSDNIYPLVLDVIDDVNSFNDIGFGGMKIETVGVLSNPLDFLIDFDFHRDVLDGFIIEELQKDMNKLMQYYSSNALFVCIPEDVITKNMMTYSKEYAMRALYFCGFISAEFKYRLDDHYLLIWHNPAADKFLQYLRNKYISQFMEASMKSFIDSHKISIIAADQAENLRRRMI